MDKIINISNLSFSFLNISLSLSFFSFVFFNLRVRDLNFATYDVVRCEITLYLQPPLSYISTKHKGKLSMRLVGTLS